MASTPDDSIPENDREYANHELRAMDERTARQTLTVDQFERWEKLNDLYDRADETREQWAGQHERVADLTVSADMDALGTAVEIYGNDLLIHVDSDDDALQAAADEFEDLRDEYTADDDFEDVTDADKRRMTDLLTRMFDAVLVRWDDTDWADLREDQRRAILADAREKWGFDSFFLAWIDVVAAVREDQEDKVDVIEQFRNPERRGNR